MSMTSTSDRVEIITSVQRRRRWSASEKIRMVEETYEPGSTVSLVARRHGVAPNQLFTWRRLAAQGALTAAGAEEEVVPASDYRALQNQIRELHRLLGAGLRSKRRRGTSQPAPCPAAGRTGDVQVRLGSANAESGAFLFKALLGAIRGWHLG